MSKKKLCGVFFFILTIVFSTHADDWTYIYDCNPDEYLDGEGKFKSGGKYTLYLCIQKRVRKRYTKSPRITITGEGGRHAPSPTGSYLGLTTITTQHPPAIETISLQSEQESIEIDTSDDQATIFSVSNMPAAVQTVPTGYMYQLIGLIDQERKEIGVTASREQSRVTEDIFDEIMKRFSRSTHYMVTGGSGGGNFNFEVSLGSQISLKDLKALRDKAAKVIDKATAEAPPPKYVLAITKAHRLLVDKLWPSVKYGYLYATSWLPVGLIASGVPSIFYAYRVRDAVAVDVDVDEPDFRGCLIALQVDTSDLLYTMASQGVTSKLFTTENTIGELYNDVVETSSPERKFSVSGYFRDFLSPECVCPTCIINNQITPNNFGNCIVTTNVNAHTMFVYLLNLYRGDLNAQLFTMGDIPANIANDPNWVFEPRSNLELIGEFVNITTREIGGVNLTCGCNPCPPVIVTESIWAGDALVFLIDATVAVTTTGLIVATIWLKRRIFKPTEN